MQTSIDLRPLTEKIALLEQELALIKRERDMAQREANEVRNKHMEHLDELEKKHNAEVQKLQTYVSELEAKITKLQEQMKQERQKAKLEREKMEKEQASLNERVSELEKELRKEKAGKLRSRHRLLLGSLAYNIIEATIEHTFPHTHRKLKVRLHTLEQIEEEAEKDPKTKERFQALKAKYFEDIEQVAEDLGTLTGGRNFIAHPCDEEDDDEGCIAPNRLQEIAREIYKQRENVDLRVRVCLLVDIF